MNYRKHKYKYLILIFYLLIPFISIAQCDFQANTSFTLSIGSQTIANGTTVKYLITDDKGVIIQIKDTPSFNGVSEGLYVAYSVVYLPSSIITGLIIGQNVKHLRGDCYDISSPLVISICSCNNICDFTTSQPININTTVNSTTSYTVTKYFLTTESGKILIISNTPSFPNQLSGNYLIYSIIYNSDFGVSGLSVNSSVSDIKGECYDIKSLAIKVCADIPSSCNFYESQTVSITSLDTGIINNYTVKYILIDRTGKILTINNSPTFGLLPNAIYQVVTVKYLSNSQVYGLQVGSPISSVFGASVTIYNLFTFNVCRDNILETNVCVNNSFTLKTNNGVSFKWVGPNGFVATGATIIRPNASTSMQGIYTVTITNSYGCTATQTANVIVNPLPTANFTTETICEGQTKTLIPSGLTNAANFLWNTGATTSAISVSPNISTNYTLTISSRASCSIARNVWIVVNPLPTADVTVINSSCLGYQPKESGMLILNKYLDSYTFAYGSPLTTTPVFVSIPFGGVIVNGLSNTTTKYTIRLKSSHGCTNDIIAQTTKISCACQVSYCEPATLSKIK